MSDSFSLSEEQEDYQLGDAPTELIASENTRLSVMSTDSGIERDLPANADSSPSSSLDNASLSTSWQEPGKRLKLDFFYKYILLFMCDCVGSHTLHNFFQQRAL